ncbi:MAG: right-handed parallel beta-helix repeat-containing protein [Myxococcales bacterium]|nr:right-handed parallel beta-helix repeat-containing protein [Myxococcales bacterium]
MQNALSCLAAATLLVAAAPAHGKTVQVGPSKAITHPNTAVAQLADGDVLEIDAGTYTNVKCNFGSRNNLTIRGVGGRVWLRGTANDLAAGKGIFVFAGSNITVEGIEFSDATLAQDKNGAGIRWQGQGLVVRRCNFHDNDDGILAGDSPNADVLIEYSIFDNNGFGDGQSHNIYVNRARKLTIQHSVFTRAYIGHEIKSRAFENLILYNRISDGNARTSRSIDLSEGGTSTLIGNVIEQGATADNNTVIGYALENPNTHTLALTLVNNTIVNKRQTVRFIQMRDTTKLTLINNIFYSTTVAGTLVAGNGTVTGQNNYVPSGAAGAGGLSGSFNGALSFVSLANVDFRLQAGSVAIDKGIAPVAATLEPKWQYVHPAMRVARAVVNGTIDVGAYEFGTPQSSDGGSPPADGGSPPSDGAATESGPPPGDGAPPAGDSARGVDGSSPGADGSSPATDSGSSGDGGGGGGDDGGCCSLAGGSAPTGGAVCLALLLLLAWSWRRRRRPI